MSYGKMYLKTRVQPANSESPQWILQLEIWNMSISSEALDGVLDRRLRNTTRRGTKPGLKQVFEHLLLCTSAGFSGVKSIAPLF